VLITPGKSFGSAEIDESVKALYGTGLFTDVTINVSGNRLVVNVVENTIVNSVVIRGNKKVKNEVLLQIIQTEPRGVLTDAEAAGRRPAHHQNITRPRAWRGHRRVRCHAARRQPPDVAFCHHRRGQLRRSAASACRRTTPSPTRVSPASGFSGAA
jgi:hypothetical protein